jgi:hypothetical protein
VSYAKVYEEFWDGEKIEPLSDRAALLGLFLLTGPHRNAIGCFRLGIGAITDIPRFGAWGIEGVSIALREMVETGFIVRDDHTGWTLVVNQLNKDPITSFKNAIHAASLAERVPTNTLVYQRLHGILAPQLEAHEKHLQGKPGYPMTYPIDTPSEGYAKPLRSPLPLPSPEPIPEPERTSSLRSDGAVAPQGRDLALAPDGSPATLWEQTDQADLKTLIFQPCLAWLCRQGNLAERSARSFLGQCIRDYGAGETLQAIMAAQRGSPLEPIAYIRTVLANDRGRQRGSDDSERLLAELQASLGDPA